MQHFPRTDTMLLLSESAQRASEVVFDIHALILSTGETEAQNLEELEQSITRLTSTLGQLQRRIRDALGALNAA